MTNTDLDTADDNGSSGISAIYSVSSGTLTMASGKTLYIPLSHTFAPGGDIEIGGDFKNYGTFTSGTSKVTVTGGGSIRTNNSSLYDLTINGAVGATLLDPLTITHNLFFAGGSATLDVSASNFGVTIGGDWDNRNDEGTFLPHNGTVTFNGTNQTIWGDTTFYNLTKTVTTTDIFSFAEASHVTITGTATLHGAANNLLSLTSTGNWYIDPQGTRAISYVDVYYSNNINATAITCSNNCTDSGNNTNWIFAVIPTTDQLLRGGTFFSSGVKQGYYWAK